ncbi:MAG TPA: M20/M25/M40 family metallo-hydrolase [Edaphocola sp.]|nr:M20/M25/M40 family metallo-hydrolase [Edaphocola sp.]
MKKIPAIALGNASADLLNELCSQQEVQAKLLSNCGMKGAVMDYNVIGELKGKTNNIITVGGHLDSWDVGEGAHDDGAGCVQSVEVLRLLKQQNIPLKNTLRIVLFANEENGAKGGAAYADSALSKNEKHIFALESDAGGFSPRGFGLVMPEPQKEIVRSWRELLLPLGVYDFSREEGGVDISPLGKKLKTPLSGLLPDTQRYFDIHHNENDIFENVNKRELELGAVAMAAMVYLVDKYF